MRVLDILAKKRDGGALRAEEIRFFIDGYTRDEIPDYQAAALLMAIVLRGMDAQETAALTAAMADSGRKIDPAALPSPALDKHSTGGVGDKTSLVVVPLLAAAGVAVCKMSGRGLGHTGGTLDKLEAIPGLRVFLSPEEMLAQVHAVGACLAGQTADLAPADGKLYALRDATATVASLPLIVASILSKKLAAGAPVFLFDVKVGNGALMRTLPEAEALARALVGGAAAHGRRAAAVLSDMNQPLGRAVGNALEVAEAARLLHPDTTASADPRLRELCQVLAVEGMTRTLGMHLDAARVQTEALLASGAALTALQRIVRAQGGDPALLESPERLERAPARQPVAAGRSGWVRAVDTQALGETVATLGGGRTNKDQAIDPRVGLTLSCGIGQRVTEGETIAQIHAADPAAAQQAAVRVRAAFVLGERPSEPPPLVYRVLASP